MIVIVIVGIIIVGMENDEPLEVEEENGVAEMEAEQEAIEVAEQWIRDNSVTFNERESDYLMPFDAWPIDDGVYEVEFEFETMYGGFGELSEEDMEDEEMRLRTISVEVVDGQVAGAVIDGTYDEYRAVMEDDEPDDERAEVDVYFVAVEDGMESVVPVEREVLAENKEESALLELLERPEDNELSTAIEEGTTLNSFLIEDGVAFADFDERLEAAGSATVAMIRDQIENTLLQFDSIEEVEISIDGETEDILQP